MDGKGLPHDAPSVTLTLRLLMAGKEVGSIIGKKGEIVKRFREESAARINISDGSCPERIVTITGSTDSIFKAFNLICKKLEEEVGGPILGSSIPRPPITLRLIIPGSQCGSLIGKGGSKIKEIRDVTGASVVVASEMLPNSTERAVTISGTSDAITQCIFHICCVMLESPPKGATIPYRPKPQVGGPVILAGGQAYTIQGNYAVPTPDMNKLGNNPLANLAALGLGGLTGLGNHGSMNTSALAALAGGHLRPGSGGMPPAAPQQSQEMAVPNELIGCIIGKGGTKIAEIRQLSGAMIRISNCEDRESSSERTITITGTAESVAAAQYLINTRILNAPLCNPPRLELETGSLLPSSFTPYSGSPPIPQPSPDLAKVIPLLPLLGNDGLSAHIRLNALNALSDVLTGIVAQQSVQSEDVKRGVQIANEAKVPCSSSLTSLNLKKERSRFSPY